MKRWRTVGAPGPGWGRRGGRERTELIVVLLEDRWSSWPRLGKEAGRERTESMVLLLEVRWSSRPRLAEGGAGRGHKWWWCCWRTDGAAGPGWGRRVNIWKFR